MRQDGMKVKAAVVVLAALLAVLCVFMLCGPLNSPLYGSTTGTPGHFATQTVPGLRLHAKIHPRPPPNVTFDPGGRDSLVFIHIPKTGGSDFLRHLVTVMRDNLTLCLPEPASLSVTPESGRENRNKKKKKDKTVCLRPNSSENDSLPKSSSGPWLISEKTLGWYCGLHPFYSEYKSCISFENSVAEERQRFDPTATFHYSTMLRHPVIRYISEYLHVQRGATFSYRHVCRGKGVKDGEMPPCYPGYYSGETWKNLTLSWFTSCESNWANNRQTLSVANLETLGCFNHDTLTREERERKLLQSAKKNLRKFSFFGITEYQAESSVLFERTFGLEFGAELEQKPVSMLKSAPMLSSLWTNETVYNRIAEANRLDMQLYLFALELFASRLLAIGIKIDLEHFSKEVQLLPTESEFSQLKRFRKQNYQIT